MLGRRGSIDGGNWYIVHHKHAADAGRGWGAGRGTPLGKKKSKSGLQYGTPPKGGGRGATPAAGEGSSTAGMGWLPKRVWQVARAAALLRVEHTEQ